MPKPLMKGPSNGPLRRTAYTVTGRACAFVALPVTLTALLFTMVYIYHGLMFPAPGRPDGHTWDKTLASAHCQAWWRAAASGWSSEQYTDGRGSGTSACGIPVHPKPKEASVKCFTGCGVLAGQEVEGAVCLSGQLRTFEKTLPGIKQHILNAFREVHVFAVTTTAEEAEVVRHSLDPHVIIVRDDPPHSMSEKLHDQQSIIEDIGFVYATPGGVSNPISTGDKHAQYWLKMLEGHALCNEIRHYYEHTEGTRYKWVVRVRWDVLFKEPWAHVPMYPDAITVPDHHHHGGYNDKFAVGPPHLMDWYFRQLDAVYNHSVGALRPYQAETFLKEHLRSAPTPARVEEVYDPVYILRPDDTFSQT